MTTWRKLGHIYILGG